MPVTVAALDRDRRYKQWYSLLLEEIAVVAKPGAPIIAIGSQVEAFLKKNDLQGKTNRLLYAVQHYSRQALSSWKKEAEMDPEGFRAFKAEEFGETSRWPTDLSDVKKRLIFAYKKRFEAIRAHG